MNCPKCEGVLKFRNPGNRGNDKNLGHRSGVVILKLVCHGCGEKWLCSDNKYSHPYQVRKKSPDGFRKIGISGRVEERILPVIKRKYGSVQKWLNKCAADVIQ